jgi:hypothetical protein
VAFKVSIVNVKETKIFEQQIFNKPQLTCFIQVDAQNQFNKFTFILPLSRIMNSFITKTIYFIRMYLSSLIHIFSLINVVLLVSIIPFPTLPLNIIAISFNHNFPFRQIVRKILQKKSIHAMKDTNLRYSVLSYWILKMFIEDLHIYSYLIFIVRYL